MRQLKRVPFALFAILVLGAVLVPTAFALPQLLGWEGNEIFKTAKRETSFVIESTKKEKLACTAVIVDGEQTSDTTGRFHLHLSGCFSSGFECNTEGDTKKTILSSGSFNYVFDVLGPVLGVAVLFQPEELVVKCTALVMLTIKGTFMCLDPEPLVAGENMGFKCTQTSGVPLETLYWDDEGREQHTQLLVSKNKGEFIGAGVAAEDSFYFEGALVSFMY